MKYFAGLSQFQAPSLKFKVPGSKAQKEIKRIVKEVSIVRFWNLGFGIWFLEFGSWIFYEMSGILISCLEDF